MGCHTWFHIPVITDKEEIIRLAQKSLDTWKDLSESNRKMYQYAIDSQLVDPVCELAANEIGGSQRDSEEWIIYKDPKDVFRELYNKENGTNYENHWNLPDDVQNKMETYSDEPRISGYPDTIIRSYDELIEFMKVGFTDDEGKHHKFRYDQERYETFMSGIKEFFTKHPKGIITFG